MIIFAALFAPVLARTLPRGAPSAQPSRADAVRNVFRTSWAGYYQHAFPHDTLHPQSGGFEDDRNEWGATAIDALTTAAIMGEKQTVADILKYVPTIDFTTTRRANDEISLFETNIRYLAGMIASYDLLKGPLKDVAPDSKAVDALLTQAQSLADSLSFAFDTGSGVPQNSLFLNPKHQASDTTNSLAGAGTLVLEWTRLSDLTGNQTYAKLVQKAQGHLVKPAGVAEPFPGLVGSTIDLKSGAFTDQNGGWTAGSDSFYEYLIKMYLYDPQQFGAYKDRWVLAADSTMQHLASHPSTAQSLTFLCDYTGTQINTRSQHLASFAGGNFILGGILLNEDKYTQFGLQLAESYWATYNRTASGIGPEAFAWDNPPAAQAGFYNASGFYVTSGSYVLRPETMESLYYAYRVTGDPKWQDMAWDSFQRMRTLCRTGVAYGGLNDVTREDGGGAQDVMESFWLAETLKYLYLIFADSPVHVQRTGNEFVFNTEAHPMRIKQATS